MVGGIVAAMLIPVFFPDWTVIYTFPLIFGVSLLSSIAGSIATNPDDEAVLMAFYRKVRPWGFWKPIHDKLAALEPGILPNKDFKRDMGAVAVGIVWQTALTAAPIFLVIRDLPRFGASMAVIVLTTLALKYLWYDKLRDEPA
jgi:hypothetical protein